MNVEIGAETALFPEKEYINGIAVAVQGCRMIKKCAPDIVFLLLKKCRYVSLRGAWVESGAVQ
jgi:hypothetical protein